MKLFQTLIKKCFPKSKINPTPWGASSFVVAQVALQAIKKADRELTREGLIDPLESLRGVDVGSVPPITFGPDKHWGTDQVLLYRIKGG